MTFHIKYIPLSRLLAALMMLSFAMFPCIADAADYMAIEVGKGIYVEGFQNVEAVFVADTTVADVTKSPENAIFVHGKAIGETTLIGVAVDGRKLFSYNLVVRENLSGVRAALSSRFPNSRITVDAAKGSVLLRGKVPSEPDHQAAVATVQSMLPRVRVIDELKPLDGRSVTLKVQFIEVAQDRLAHYGIDWNALSSLNGIQSAGLSGSQGQRLTQILNLLLDQGVATVASQSNLSALNGAKANLTIGNEIALPKMMLSDTGSGQTVGTEYKPVGLSLDFQPTLMDNDRVSLAINSTVSSIVPVATGRNTGVPPTLSTRRLGTTIDLESGQAYVVAALSRTDTLAEKDQPAALFGAKIARHLFGSDKTLISQRDLIVVVTPHFGKVIIPATVLAKSRTQLEELLTLKASHCCKGNAPQIRLFGQPGFLY